jgi:hypothetical protein
VCVRFTKYVTCTCTCAVPSIYLPVSFAMAAFPSFLSLCRIGRCLTASPARDRESAAHSRQALLAALHIFVDQLCPLRGARDARLRTVCR